MKTFCYCEYPCPCGYYGDAQKACICASSTVTKYQKRISGPLLDRIDIHIEVPRVDYDKLSSDRLGEESSAKIRARVQAARQRQLERFKDTDIICPVREPGLSPRARTGSENIQMPHSGSSM